MSTYAQLADLFDDIASVLELLGENPFKVAANAKVARVLKAYCEVFGLGDVA